MTSILRHIEYIGWNNITFGSQGDIGIIHSFSDFDPGMTPCDIELLLGGAWASAGRLFIFELKTFMGKGRLLHVIACPQLCITSFSVY